ncbi:hypothetical protein R3X27_20160 [Tropicimonas sp. TH_r6]|nr:hypothetical protein [Tropicimonas sp. TH_r6]MDV7145000.1 hypothetical protein [Tropicimonas sp. TH_r6]
MMQRQEQEGRNRSYQQQSGIQAGHERQGCQRYGKVAHRIGQQRALRAA